MNIKDLNYTPPPPMIGKLYQIIGDNKGRYTLAAVALGIHPPTLKTYMSGGCTPAKRMEIETLINNYLP